VANIQYTEKEQKAHLKK